MQVFKTGVNRNASGFASLNSLWASTHTFIEECWIQILQITTETNIQCPLQLLVLYDYGVPSGLNGQHTEVSLINDVVLQYRS